jgi:serine protease Do
MQDLDTKLVKSLGVSDKLTGVVVASVSQGSPAEASGLRQGDVIQKLDGEEVNTSKQIQSIVRKHKPGDELNLLVIRSGALKAIPVKLGKYPTNSDSQQDQTDESP